MVPFPEYHTTDACHFFTGNGKSFESRVLKTLMKDKVANVKQNSFIIFSPAKSFVDLHSLLAAKQPNVSQKHPSRNADSSLVSYEHPEFVHEQKLTNNAFSH